MGPPAPTWAHQEGQGLEMPRVHRVQYLFSKETEFLGSNSQYCSLHYPLCPSAAGPGDNTAAPFFSMGEGNIYPVSGSKPSCSSSCALVALDARHNSSLWDNLHGCFKHEDKDDVQVKTRIGQNSPELSNELPGEQLQTRFLLLVPPSPTLLQTLRSIC